MVGIYSWPFHPLSQLPLHHYANDPQLYLSFPPVDSSGCLPDISAWMKDHFLYLSLSKLEIVVRKASPSIRYNIKFNLGLLLLLLSRSTRNLEATIYEQSVIINHTVLISQSCRFDQYVRMYILYQEFMT